MRHPAIDVPLCMDDRMLGTQGTGVATYAQALQAAQTTIRPDALLLTAGPSHTVNPSTAQRARRSLRALAGHGQAAQPASAGFLSPDVFGLSHAYFTLHGRALPIRVPGPAGIMHWSYPLPARIAGWKNLYTVHDLIPLIRPDLTPIDPRRHVRILDAIVRSGGALVTVSEASRRELAEHPATTHAPVWNCSQPVESPSAVRDARLLPDNLAPRGYLLVCGAVEPRKNVARIIAAYQRAGLEMPLVIAGPDGWRAETLTPLLLGQSGVVRLGYQPRETILALIAHARCLLFPSLAEGFGLPVIEAMALATPVLTSNAGALAEVAGGAACLVDPEDTGAIADGLRRLATEDAYCRQLTERGQIRAGSFTAESFAAKLRGAYSEALYGSPSDQPAAQRDHSGHSRAMTTACL